MRRDAEDFFGADEFAGFEGGEIGLADVEAVGVGEDGDVGAVVDDGDHFVFFAEIDEGLCAAKEFAAVKFFFAQLQAISAAEDGLLGGFKPGTFAERFGDENAEFYVGELCGMKRAGDLLFEIVEAVAEFFDFGGGGGIEDFGEFFEGAEGFAEAFAGGGDYRGDVGAGQLGVGFIIYSDNLGGVTMADCLREEGA